MSAALCTTLLAIIVLVEIHWVKHRMSMSIVFVLACCLGSRGASAEDAPAMTFEDFGVFFGIYAHGLITMQTPDDFATFLMSHPQRSRVVLDSGGGSLDAGMRLGQLIRAAGLHTSVGRPRSAIHLGFRPINEEISDMFPASGMCASACTFAFIGGIKREVPEASRFGVHRFFSDQPGGSGDDPEASAQVASGILLQYIRSMGVDSAMYIAMSKGGRTEEEVMWLDQATMAQLNIVTSNVIKATLDSDLRILHLSSEDTGRTVYSLLDFWCADPNFSVNGQRYLVTAYFPGELIGNNFRLVWGTEPGGRVEIPPNAYRFRGNTGGRLTFDIAVTSELLYNSILNARYISVELDRPGQLADHDSLGPIPGNFPGAVERSAKGCY